MTEWAYGWCFAFAICWGSDIAKVTVAKSRAAKDSTLWTVVAWMIGQLIGSALGYAVGWVSYAFAQGVMGMLR